MELRELGDRLLRLHAKLILFFLIAGVLGGLAFHMGDKPQYQAHTLFVMGVPDPQSAESAAVLADTARGMATGPQLVTKAMAQAGVTRDITAVANTINVQSVGTSGVLSLSVADQNPQVAVKLSNALAADVVSTRIALLQNGIQSSLNSLRRQQASADKHIEQLTGRIERLIAQGAGGLPTSPGEGQLTALQARLTSLQDLATQISVQRNDLEAQLGPKTAVIDTADAAVRIHGRTLDDAVLGGVLGLVLGIAIAGGLEVARPSLVGAASISRIIGTPLLGEMSTPPDSWSVSDLPDAGSYVELAADAQHVREVRFAALDPNGRRHRARVRMLEGPLHRLRFGRSPAGGRAAGTGGNGSLRVKTPAAAAAAAAASASSAVAGPDGNSSPHTGLVVAVPRVLKVADVDALTNFIWISGWTLLGVIVYDKARKKIMPIRRGPDSADSEQDSPVSQPAEVDA